MKNDKPQIQRSNSQDVQRFLQKAAALPRHPSAHRGRLIFAMDATASREPSWDHACQIQGQMFEETASLGGLEIQLCFYRGFNDFQAFAWRTKADQLHQDMQSVYCVGGHTHILSVLQHAAEENRINNIQALVFVGDCIEEDIDDLCNAAGKLALQGVPLFLFQEGNDTNAMRGFKQLARITQGAYSPFDIHSADQLKELLSAVAVFASGGLSALDQFHKRIGKTVLKIGHSQKP